MADCTFSGYDVALDSTAKGLINAGYGNVFYHNEIAARVDIRQPESGVSVNLTKWEQNVFVNNHIAVQVLSLNNLLSPYYFRVCDSDFINNDVDFDAQCGGTLYFYRNYRHVQR